jgi:alanine racemase
MGPLDAAELHELSMCEVVAWTPDFVERAAVVGRERGSAVRLHLKLDTGMGRLGARPETMAELLDTAERTDGIEVVGVMTHFATADETEGPNAGFFREQLVRFRSRFAEVKERFPDARAHAANSAALLRDPSASFDLVRCGIALYGGDPF